MTHPMHQKNQCKSKAQMANKSEFRTIAARTQIFSFINYKKNCYKQQFVAGSKLLQAIDAYFFMLNYFY